MDQASRLGVTYSKLIGGLSSRTLQQLDQTMVHHQYRHDIYLVYTSTS